MVKVGSLKPDSCVYIYLESGTISILTLSADDVLLVGKDRKALERIKRKLTGSFSMTDMRGVPFVLGKEVTPDRTKGTVTTALVWYGMANCNPPHTSCAGNGRLVDQSEEKLLNKEGKQLFQTTTRSVMYLRHVTC